MAIRGRPKKAPPSRRNKFGVPIPSMGPAWTMEDRVLSLSPAGQRRWVERRLDRDAQNLAGEDGEEIDFVWKPRHPALVALRDEVWQARKTRSEALKVIEAPAPLTRQQRRFLARSEAKKGGFEVL